MGWFGKKDKKDKKDKEEKKKGGEASEKEDPAKKPEEASGQPEAAPPNPGVQENSNKQNESGAAPPAEAKPSPATAAPKVEVKQSPTASQPHSPASPSPKNGSGANPSPKPISVEERERLMAETGRTAEETQALRVKLTAFCVQHRPNELPEVDRFLCIKMPERELLTAVHDKYKVPMKDTLTQKDLLRLKLVSFYLQHNPNDVLKVEKLIEMDVKEEELMAALREKYNVKETPKDNTSTAGVAGSAAPSQNHFAHESHSAQLQQQQPDVRRESEMMPMLPSVGAPTLPPGIGMSASQANSSAAPSSHPTPLQPKTSPPAGQAPPPAAASASVLSQSADAGPNAKERALWRERALDYAKIRAPSLRDIDVDAAISHFEKANPEDPYRRMWQSMTKRYGPEPTPAELKHLREKERLAMYLKLVDSEGFVDVDGLMPPLSEGEAAVEAMWDRVQRSYGVFLDPKKAEQQQRAAAPAPAATPLGTPPIAPTSTHSSPHQGLAAPDGDRRESALIPTVPAGTTSLPIPSPPSKSAQPSVGNSVQEDVPSQPPVTQAPAKVIIVLVLSGVTMRTYERADRQGQFQFNSAVASATQRALNHPEHVLVTGVFEALAGIRYELETTMPSTCRSRDAGATLVKRVSATGDFPLDLIKRVYVERLRGNQVGRIAVVDASLVEVWSTAGLSNVTISGKTSAAPAPVGGSAAAAVARTASPVASRRSGAPGSIAAVPEDNKPTSTSSVYGRPVAGRGREASPPQFEESGVQQQRYEDTGISNSMVAGADGDMFAPDEMAMFAPDSPEGKGIADPSSRYHVQEASSPPRPQGYVTPLRVGLPLAQDRVVGGYRTSPRVGGPGVSPFRIAHVNPADESMWSVPSPSQLQMQSFAGGAADASSAEAALHHPSRAAMNAHLKRFGGGN